MTKSEAGITLKSRGIRERRRNIYLAMGPGILATANARRKETHMVNVHGILARAILSQRSGGNPGHFNAVIGMIALRNSKAFAWTNQDPDPKCSWA